MKEGWEVRKLGEVCKQIFAGGDVPKGRNSKFRTDEFDIPIYSNGAKDDGLYGYTDIAKVTEDSITVSARGTIGFSMIRTESYLPVVRLIVLIPDENYVLLKFLKYAIETMDFGNSGTSIPQLTVPMIKRHKSPIPPLPEQKKIVRLLDRAFADIDAATANIERNLENARELFQSRLEEVFEGKGEDWETTTLKEVAEFKNGMNFTKMSTGETVKIVGVGDFKNNFFVPQDNLQSKVIDGQLPEIYNLKDGDILTVRSNGNPKLIGRCILAKNVKGNTSHSGFTIRIRVKKENVSPAFICHFLKSPKAKQQLIDSGNGVGIKSLNQTALSSVRIRIPTDIEKQEDVVGHIFEVKSKFDRLRLIYQEKLQNLEDLKKSLLQRAFAGELVYKGK